MAEPRPMTPARLVDFADRILDGRAGTHMSGWDAAEWLAQMVRLMYPDIEPECAPEDDDGERICNACSEQFNVMDSYATEEYCPEHAPDEEDSECPAS